MITFSRDEVVKGSDKHFGLFFSAVFVIVSVYPLLHGGNLRVSTLLAAALFLVLALCKPHWLSPLNYGWMCIGYALHKIMNPLIMAVIFYVIITPLGILMRLRGKDVLKLKTNKEAASYWVARTPPGPDPKTLNRQF